MQIRKDASDQAVRTLTESARVRPGRVRKDPMHPNLAWPLTSRIVDHCRRGVEQLGSSLGS